MLRATELTGGASVPPAPSPWPTAAAGTVQGVWLALGPVLFLTGTLRESGYECMKSDGHETVRDAPRCAEWHRGIDYETQIAYIFISVLSTNSSFL